MPESRLERTRRAYDRGTDNRDKHAVAVAESFVRNNQKPPRIVHAPGAFDVVSMTYPCSCGGRWYMGIREPYHVDPSFDTDRDPGDEAAPRRLRRRSS